MSKIEDIINRLESAALTNHMVNGPGTQEAYDQFMQAATIIRQCRERGFIDEKGNVRKVLGTLPVTADGYLAGSAAELWWRDSEDERTRHIMVLPCDVADCYSNPEACVAAAAAKEARKCTPTSPN